MDLVISKILVLVIQKLTQFQKVQIEDYLILLKGKLKNPLPLKVLSIIVKAIPRRNNRLYLLKNKGVLYVNIKK